MNKRLMRARKYYLNIVVAICGLFLHTFAFGVLLARADYLPFSVLSRSEGIFLGGAIVYFWWYCFNNLQIYLVEVIKILE